MTTARDGIGRRIRALLETGTVGDLSDGRLLDRFLTRDGESAEAAFAALVERHGPMVWRACRSILADPNDADDAFQATFLALARRSRSLWVRDSLGPWLLQVARRTSLHARARARDRRLREQAAAGERSPLVEPRPLDDLAAIHEEVARLPGRYREVVVLCLLEGLPDEQAAARLGWPLGTVHSRLARGRERLRRSLTRRGLAPAAALAAVGSPIDAISAALPPRLLAATVRAASPLAEAGVRSASLAAALTLMEGAVRMSWLAKMKAGTAIVAAFGGIALATAVGSQEESSTHPEAHQPPAGAVPASKTDTPPAAPRAKDDPYTSHVSLIIRGGMADHAVALGTVIASKPAESLILTCGRAFHAAHDADAATRPARLAGDVEVLLSTPLPELGGGGYLPQVPEPESHPGEVVDFDWRSDVGLVRIRPGRVLPSTPVVRRGWRFARGEPLVMVDRFLSGVTLTKPTTFVEAYEQAGPTGLLKTVRCSESPRIGVMGSGLFLASGPGEAIVGVCNAVQRQDDALYASPEMIHEILDRNGLSALIPAAAAESATTEGPPAAGDLPPTSSPPFPEVTELAPAPVPLTDPPSEVARPANEPASPIVRIYVNDDSPKRAMGTIVASSRNSTLILTAGSLFAPDGRMKGVTIVVLAAPVDGVFASAAPEGYTFTAKLVDCDLERNVALLQIVPGRVLPTARIEPAGRKPIGGAPLFSYHYADSGRVRATEFPLVDTYDAWKSNGGVYKALVCKGLPKLDEVGMPLAYNEHEADARGVVVVGVCNFATTTDGSNGSNELGIFAGPEMIHHILAANGLSSLTWPQAPFGPYAPTPPFNVAGGDGRATDVERPEALSPAPSAKSGPLPELSRRVDEIDRKLDRILESLQGAADPGKAR